MPAVLQGIDQPEASAPERQSVLQRGRSDYDPLGVRLGSFVATPVVEATENYSSNVYATSGKQIGDVYTAVRPSLGIQSDWNNHMIGVQAVGEIKRFNERVSENVSNFSGSIEGRLDQQREIFFTGDVGYQIQHEDRASPDAVNGKNPVEYEVATAAFGYVHETGRLGIRLAGTAIHYQYEDAVSDTGLKLIETDRNRTEITARARLEYEIVPGYHAFVTTIGNERIYDGRFNAGGFDRSSHGYEVDVGTAISLGPTLNGEVYGGFLEQDFDDKRLKPSSGIGFGANLLWNVTDLTSLRLAIVRTVEETIIASASSILQTSFTLAAEHELLRNLLISGTLNFTTDGYAGLARTDNIYGGQLGIKYLLNRNFSAQFSAGYNTRESNVDSADFGQALISGTVRLQF